MSPLLETVFTFDIRHDPDTACEPTGPGPTRVDVISPVTGWVPVLSVNFWLSVFPSGEIVCESVSMTFPSFFWMISIELAFMTCTPIVS